MSWAKLLAIVREIDAQAADELAMIAAPEEVGPGQGHRSDQEPPDQIRKSLANVGGTSSAYPAARLRRGRPDLAAEVGAGRMRLRDAARKAGIVKPSEPYRQLVLWWDRASPKDRAC